jgi:hypothetical protein
MWAPPDTFPGSGKEQRCISGTGSDSVVSESENFKNEYITICGSGSSKKNHETPCGSDLFPSIVIGKKQRTQINK